MFIFKPFQLKSFQNSTKNSWSCFIRIHSFLCLPHLLYHCFSRSAHTYHTHFCEPFESIRCSAPLTSTSMGFSGGQEHLPTCQSVIIRIRKCDINQHNVTWSAVNIQIFPVIPLTYFMVCFLFCFVFSRQFRIQFRILNCVIVSFLSPVVFLNLLLSFIAETWLKWAGSLFSKMSLDLIYMMVPCEQIQVMNFLQAYFRGNALSFSGFWFAFPHI